MKFLTKCGVAIIVSSAVWSAATAADERVEVKGYYREDGSYVYQRVIDPIVTKSVEGFPALSSSPAARRREIERFYEGKVVTAKVSFPACHGGLELDADHVEQSNVELFRRVNKYGISIEKGAKAVITGVKVGDGFVSVELNGGGYGSAGDVAARVAGDVFTLGFLELKDRSQDRYQRGSRLLISLPARDDARFTAADVDADAFKKSLARDGAAHALLLQALGADKDGLDGLTADKIADALNGLAASADLRSKLDVASLALSKKDQSLLASAAKKPLDADKAMELNRDVLRAAFAQEIRPADGLDFTRLNEVLSLALEF